jgi:hypothetical protein
VAEFQTLDCMHDFLEGVDPFLVMLVFREIVVNHKDLNFSAKFINSRITFFEYGRSDLSNQPFAKFTDQALRKVGNYCTKQRAGQSWCLIRVFPLMFGDRIPFGHPAYRFYSLIL